MIIILNAFESQTLSWRLLQFCANRQIQSNTIKQPDHCFACSNFNQLGWYFLIRSNSIDAGWCSLEWRFTTSFSAMASSRTTWTCERPRSRWDQNGQQKWGRSIRFGQMGRSFDWFLLCPKPPNIEHFFWVAKRILGYTFVDIPIVGLRIVFPSLQFSKHPSQPVRTKVNSVKYLGVCGCIGDKS